MLSAVNEMLSVLIRILMSDVQSLSVFVHLKAFVPMRTSDEFFFQFDMLL